MSEGNTNTRVDENTGLVEAPSASQGLSGDRVETAGAVGPVIEVHYFSKDDPMSWHYMPQLLYRVYEFCRKTDGETEPREAVDLIRAWFMVGDPSRLALWAIIVDGRIRAHLFATTEPFGMDHFRYTLVRQAEVDDGMRLDDAVKEIYNQVCTWTKNLGLRKVLLLTHRNEAAMMRKWGFQPYKSLMRLSLDSVSS